MLLRQFSAESCDKLHSVFDGCTFYSCYWIFFLIKLSYLEEFNYEQQITCLHCQAGAAVANAELGLTTVIAEVKALNWAIMQNSSVVMDSLKESAQKCTYQPIV